MDKFPVLQNELLTTSNKQISVKIPSLSGIRILLAEDDKHLQILCKTFVERNNGEIHIVSNGQGAVEYLAQQKVDVVLLDMQMPLHNGIQVAKHIREKLLLNCPIIGCSANLLDVEHTPEELQNLDEFITKPYTEFKLITEILHQFELKTYLTVKDDFKAILNKLRKKEGDELVNEFENIFKRRVPQDVKDLIQARKNRNFVELQNKAHYLSTTLITLKFSQGFTLSQELEKAIENKRSAFALMLSDRFIDYLNIALTEM